MDNQITNNEVVRKLTAAANLIQEMMESDKILSNNVLIGLIYANLKTASEIEEQGEKLHGHGIKVYTQTMVKYCLGIHHEHDDEEDEKIITDKMERLLEVAHVRASTYARFFAITLNSFDEFIAEVDNKDDEAVLGSFYVALISNVSCVHTALTQNMVFE